jgi:large subunit ribosomal protein L32
MAVPKKKTSKSKRNMRRSHHALKPINVVINATTGEYQLPHHISAADGYYGKKKVILEKQEA